MCGLDPVLNATGMGLELLDWMIMVSSAFPVAAGFFIYGYNSQNLKYIN